MKIIDLEAHFYTQEYVDFVRGREGLTQLTKFQDSLLDLGEERLKVMDAASIDMQVLSLNDPHIQMLEVAEGTAWGRKVNDTLSAVVKEYPDRFIGLAAVAPQNPGEAADELERAVAELGLKGVCLQSHVRNEYLDDQKYWLIFERAEKLDVPIYIHPTTPSTAILKSYADYGRALSGPAFGFAAEVALHTMRLIYSGLFDRYPKLKIILGHMGEGLPYWLFRLDYYWLKARVSEGPKIERKPSEYLKRNFTITTSGMFFQPALICAYLALGADKIAFAVDYPYEENGEAVQFMKQAPICDSDKEKIYHLTAERLFKL